MFRGGKAIGVLVRETAWRVLSRMLLTALIAVGFAAFCGATANAQTLDAVRARGHLVCGSTDPSPGFAQQGKDGLWSGFDVDFCRAVAAAVFGDPRRVVFVPYEGVTRLAPLQVGEVDLLARNGPWTIQRDNSYRVHFVGTSFYDGQAFMVPHRLDIVSAYELNDVTVCVLASGDQLSNLREFFFQNQATFHEIIYEDRRDLAIAYKAGICNAVSAPASWLFAMRRDLADPAMHRILPERISKDPLGPVVREGDDEWFNIVRWTLEAMIASEELGVTSLNIKSMEAVKTPEIRRLLGLNLDLGKGLRLSPTWMADVISTVGNYGEIYARNFGPQNGPQLLRGLNALWTEGGLLYAPPIM